MIWNYKGRWMNYKLVKSLGTCEMARQFLVSMFQKFSEHDSQVFLNESNIIELSKQNIIIYFLYYPWSRSPKRT